MRLCNSVALNPMTSSASYNKCIIFGEEIKWLSLFEWTIMIGHSNCIKTKHLCGHCIEHLFICLRCLPHNWHGPFSSALYTFFLHRFCAVLYFCPFSDRFLCVFFCRRNDFGTGNTHKMQHLTRDWCYFFWGNYVRKSVA